MASSSGSCIELQATAARRDAAVEAPEAPSASGHASVEQPEGAPASGGETQVEQPEAAPASGGETQVEQPEGAPASGGETQVQQPEAAPASGGETQVEEPDQEPWRPLLLVAIENDLKARLYLREWKEELEGLERDYDREVRIYEKSNADLNQAIGLFVVFQGVILTAATQISNNPECHKIQLGFIWALSLLASFCALANSYAKLKTMFLSEEQYNGHEISKKKLTKMISKLKEKGPGDENYRPEKVRGDAEDQTTGSECSTIFRSFFVVWVFSYAGAVLLTICGFGGMTLVAVYEILC